MIIPSFFASIQKASKPFFASPDISTTQFLVLGRRKAALVLVQA
jgi:hypothetical protein